MTSRVDTQNSADNDGASVTLEGVSEAHKDAIVIAALRVIVSRRRGAYSSLKDALRRAGLYKWRQSDA